MNTCMVAKQTEYQGVVFRSKCEAIFAKCMDLTGLDWEYEPKEWKTEDGWVPDFKSITMTKDHKIRLMLIEYKPDDVTETYLNQMSERVKELIEGANYTFRSAYLACGSPYNQTRKVYALRGHKDCMQWSQAQDMINRLFWRIEEAGLHRFDLK